MTEDTAPPLLAREGGLALLHERAPSFDVILAREAAIDEPRRAVEIALAFRLQHLGGDLLDRLDGERRVRGDSDQKRRSHAMARLSPPPMQYPWIFASTGFGYAEMREYTASVASLYVSTAARVARSFSNLEMSTPDTNAFPPAPASTTTRT